MVTLAMISMIVFTGVRMIPGDPARVMAGTEADEAGLAEVREKYGLNDPVPVQYLRWVGIMLILFFSVRLGWLPASGFIPFLENPRANLTRMLMPAFVLGATLAAVLMRQTRNSMIEVMGADY